MAGILYVVATPIGNLGDITRRAAETLSAVSLIAAEDTRHTRKLLSAMGIGAKLISLHEYSDPKRIAQVVEVLLSGEDVALVSDAGTPLISDPGEALIAAAIAAGVTVCPIPGACAGITALCAAGISARRFLFYGFLPRDNTRRAELKTLVESPYTTVLYESPHHLRATLSELAELMPDRSVAICRELTKLHEEFLRMTVSEAARFYEENEPRGEFVLVIAGRPIESAEPTDEDIKAFLSERLAAGDSTKAAAAAAAGKLAVPKNRAYTLALELKQR